MLLVSPGRFTTVWDLHGMITVSENIMVYIIIIIIYYLSGGSFYFFSPRLSKTLYLGSWPSLLLFSVLDLQVKLALDSLEMPFLTFDFSISS